MKIYYLGVGMVYCSSNSDVEYGMREIVCVNGVYYAVDGEFGSNHVILWRLRRMDNRFVHDVKEDE